MQMLGNESMRGARGSGLPRTVPRIRTAVPAGLAGTPRESRSQQKAQCFGRPLQEALPQSGDALLHPGMIQAAPVRLLSYCRQTGAGYPR